MFAEGLLRGARILVTGGGSGLGKDIASACAKLGTTVCLWPSPVGARRSGGRDRRARGTDRVRYQVAASD